MRLVAARVTYLHSPDGAFQWWYKTRELTDFILFQALSVKPLLNFVPLRWLKEKVKLKNEQYHTLMHKK